MASKDQPALSTKLIHDLGRQNEFVVSDPRRLPYQPIMLYFRGMEKSGVDQPKTKGGATSFQYEFSLLSEGIKCATQGCKYCCGMKCVFVFLVFKH